MTTTTTTSTTTFTRTDRGDGAEETLTVVRFTDGRSFYAEALDAETPFVVEVTTETDRVALCDLDGEVITVAHGDEWEVATDVPDDVVEALEQWDRGGRCDVVRVA